MIWTLQNLLASVSTTSVCIDGKWIPARPENWRFTNRWKAAWMVLRGKADAVVWPGNQ